MRRTAMKWRREEREVTAILQVPDMGLTEALKFAERQRQLALNLAEDLASLLRESPMELPEEGNNRPADTP